MDKHPKPEPQQNGDGEESLEQATPEALDNAPMMMTADDIAECLKLSVRTVWRLKAKGDLPESLKIGRAVRWKRSDILEWIEQGCPASTSIIDKLMFLIVWRPIYMLTGRL